MIQKNNYITQPAGSKLCGHCCLATLMEITLEQAVALIGHKKGTKSKEIIKYLPPAKKRIGVPVGNIKALCVARLHSMPSKGKWHWVLYLNGGIYDPLAGGLINPATYKISSYFELI